MEFIIHTPGIMKIWTLNAALNKAVFTKVLMHKHTQFIMQLFTLYTDSDRKQVFVEEYPETGSVFLLEEFKPTAR